MPLRDYLLHHAITETAFARLIGVSQAAVNRYCKGRVPAAAQLQAIIRVTQGAVTANDFFGSPTSEINSHPQTDAAEAPLRTPACTSELSTGAHPSRLAQGPGDVSASCPPHDAATGPRPSFSRANFSSSSQHRTHNP